jgi:hypothetical protein
MLLLLPGFSPAKAQGQIKAIKFAADPMIVPLDRRKIPRDTIKSLADARESSIQSH